MSSPLPPVSFSASDVVRAYHQRTKHRFDGYARGPEALDWDDQPAAFRHFAGAPSVPLPRLPAVAAGSALAAALQRPFAELGVSDELEASVTASQAALPPDLATLGAFLQLSLAITAWKSYGPDRWAVRANPSSGNLHPVEAYLQVAGIDGLADGLYHYRAEDHALERRAGHGAAAGSAPQVNVVLTSVTWREAWKYGERAFRYCQLDTGHAVGALRYAAAVLGWSLHEAPQLGNATLARLVGVDRAADFPVPRHADTETEEAELLLAVGFAGSATAPPLPEAAALHALADGAEWFGVASTIDRHPLYRWPVIGEVARATRQDDGWMPAASVSAASPVTSAPTPMEASFARPTPPVAAMLTARRSAQRFDPQHIMPGADFAALLARLQPAAGLPWDVFPDAPQAMPVLFIHRVEGLAPGVYLLPRDARLFARVSQALAGRFALTPVAGFAPLVQLVTVAPAELQRLARSLHCHQDIAAHACFALGMLFPFDAALATGPAAYRRLYREAGLLGQVLYLAAEACGLRGTGIGCFFDDPVHAVLGLDGTAWQTLYHFTVGLPVDDARIESSPAYTG